MRNIFLSVGAVLVASLLTVSVSWAAGFLINGSFELGDYSGWTPVSGPVPVVIDTIDPAYLGVDPFEGDFFASLSANSEISQSAIVPQTCGAAAVRFAVYEAPSDAKLQAGWSSCGLTTTPISVSDGSTWLQQEHWRIGCSDTDDTFMVSFQSEADQMSLDDIEIVCVPGATPGGSGLVTVNVAWPDREWFDPFGTQGNGPEPVMMWYRVVWFCMYVALYIFLRVFDNSQFLLLWTFLFCFAAWGVNSIDASFVIMSFYIASVVFFRIVSFFKVTAGGL